MTSPLFNRVLKSKKGQALLESMIALPLAIVITTGLVFLLYRTLVFHYVQYHLHESLICLSGDSVHFCEKNFLEKMAQIGLGPKKTTVTLQRRSSKMKGKVSIKMKFKADLAVEQNVSL